MKEDEEEWVCKAVHRVGGCAVVLWSKSLGADALTESAKEVRDRQRFCSFAHARVG